MKARALNVRRYLSIAVVIALAAVTPGLIACRREPQRVAHRFEGKATAAMARELAVDATTGDPDYFTGLTPDREGIPVLMQRIARSGIATNYADHLVYETSDSAILEYRLRADDTSATSFAVKLRLIDGEVLVEQIVMGDPEDPGESPATPIRPAVSSERLPVEIGRASVSVSIESDRLRGYGLHSALVGYTNTSDEGTSVPVPLDVQLRITDRDDTAVPDELARDVPLAQTRRQYLPPLETIHASARFVAPKPGQYRLQGQANGIWSSAVNLETTR